MVQDMYLSNIKPAMRNATLQLHRLIPEAIPRAFTGPFVPIFMLHRFDMPERNIKGHNISFLREALNFFSSSGYRAISLDNLAELLKNGKKLPSKTAVFTIDDGFIDQFEVAAPLFSEYDIPLTYFLVSDFIDSKLWPWDDMLHLAINKAKSGSYQITLPQRQLNIELKDELSRRQTRLYLQEILKTQSQGDIYSRVNNLCTQLHVELPSSPPKQYQAMSWDNARTLSSSGHRIGAHTRTHRILSQLNNAESRKEIVDSVQRIRSEITDSSQVFAYPTGREKDFSSKEYQALEEANQIAAVTTISGNTFGHHAKNMYALPRFSMPNNMKDFIQYLTWIEALKDKLRAQT